MRLLMVGAIGPASFIADFTTRHGGEPRANPKVDVLWKTDRRCRSDQNGEVICRSIVVDALGDDAIQVPSLSENVAP